ncbi:hypothetical protein [Streptomyces sp. NPDC018352]|uniref:hypothetical protein n=1 Tax=Streptomyces sp. NPDC018352 TaxID=3157194 RepID=UPI0033C972C6
MLRAGLPKGRLLPRSKAAVAAFHDNTRESLHHRFLRMPDLPGLVAEGLLDVAIAGEEWLVDSGADVVRIAPLCWYHVRICALCRADSVPPAHTAAPVRVVSEYAHIAGDFARERWGDGFTQRTVRGSVEYYLPDLAVECVETGESMRRRGLVAMETLFEADVWLICSRAAAADSGTLPLLKNWATVIAAPAPQGGPAHRQVAIPAGAQPPVHDARS